MLTPKQYDTLTNMLDARDKAVSDLHSESVDRNTAAYEFVEATNALEQFILSLVPDTLTTDEADGWIEWGGGNCPVSVHSYVEVKFCDGETAGGAERAGGFNWGRQKDMRNIVAYRIV